MAPPKPTRAAPEPRTTEELEQLEAQRQAEAEPTDQQKARAQIDVGELEERAQQAEDRAEAAERRVLTLEEEMNELRAQVAMLARGRSEAILAARIPRADGAVEIDPDDPPIFDESLPHGIVVGDLEVAYVQNGHQFDRQQNYIATEQHRGTPRAFNPRLVGMTRPRPGQKALDPLEGFRDQ